MWETGQNIKCCCLHTLGTVKLSDNIFSYSLFLSHCHNFQGNIQILQTKRCLLEGLLVFPCFLNLWQVLVMRMNFNLNKPTNKYFKKTLLEPVHFSLLEFVISWTELPHGPLADSVLKMAASGQIKMLKVRRLPGIHDPRAFENYIIQMNWLSYILYVIIY